MKLLLLSLIGLVLSGCNTGTVEEDCEGTFIAKDYIWEVCSAGFDKCNTFTLRDETTPYPFNGCFYVKNPSKKWRMDYLAGWCGDLQFRFIRLDEKEFPKCVFTPEVEFPEPFND